MVAMLQAVRRLPPSGRRTACGRGELIRTQRSGSYRRAYGRRVAMRHVSTSNSPNFR